MDVLYIFRFFFLERYRLFLVHMWQRFSLVLPAMIYRTDADLSVFSPSWYCVVLVSPVLCLV